MKKINQNLFLPAMLLAGIFSGTSTQAQWIRKASGITTSQRGIVELIAVDNSVAWGFAGPVVDLPNAPVNEFTRTIDGGNHWTPGKISAFPEFTLVGIAPLSATLCYGSLANFDNGVAKVVKTTDGGISWTEQFNYDFGQAFSFFADIYFFNANDGLIFGDPSNGYFTIFTTHDGGNHWTRVPEANMPAALPDEFSYVFSAEGIGSIFWTVSTAGRIWKSIDKGLHWAAYETGETNIEFSSLKMRDALHGLWVVHGELYRTSDGAITWEEVETTGTMFTNDLAYVPGTASTYVSTGSQDFPGYAPNASLHGIGSSYTLDDGNTWITIDTAVEHLAVAMINCYTGFTGGVNKNGPTCGIFKYNGPALGYSCENGLTSLCHNGNTICVGNGSIANHLLKGDVLGDCSSISSLTLNNKQAVENSQAAERLNAYPNPFFSSTTITYSVPKAEKVSLIIFDITGRPIKTLVNSGIAAGTYTIQWNVNGEKEMPAGVYFLSMSTENFSQTIKLVVIK
ncbi:MAG TPA: T9SS type A sorting domain-containing protein [Chitinophagaceae bacterium]